MTKKGAANFIRWKFLTDLGKDASLKNVIVSHPDFDHYGGMLDRLAGKVMRPDRTFPVKVENFYHCGMGRFASAPKLGKTVNGSVAELRYDDYGLSTEDGFITELLDGKSSFAHPPRPFEATFAKLATLVATVANKVRRLSHADKYVPGYEPDAGAVSIRILGPVLEDVIGKGIGLRELGSESVTRNGHSLVLRVEYNKVRFLLTGDLNTASKPKGGAGPPGQGTGFYQQSRCESSALRGAMPAARREVRLWSPSGALVLGQPRVFNPPPSQRKSVVREIRMLRSVRAGGG